MRSLLLAAALVLLAPAVAEARVTSFDGTQIVLSFHPATFIVAGTADTLFTLKEAITNYAILKANGVPAKMLPAGAPIGASGSGTLVLNPADAASGTVATAGRAV